MADVRSASTSPAPADVADAEFVVQVLPHPQLPEAHSLANLIASEPERFANGDQTIAQLSALALKQLFDLSVKSESLAVPSIGAFLHTISPQEETKSRKTRSSAKRKRGQNVAAAPEPPTEHPLFQPTPLDELIIDGMDARQLWEQIDLKGSKVQSLLSTVLVNENGQSDEKDEEDEDEDRNGFDGEASDEDESDEDNDDKDPGEQRVKLSDLTDADLRALGIDPAQRDQIAFDNDDSDDDDEPYAGASDISDGDPNEVYYEPLRTEAEQRRRKEQQESAMLPWLRSQASGDDEDDEDDWDMDEDEDGDESEADGGEPSKKSKSILDSLDEPGSSGVGPSGKGKRHPTLDDDFFSINEFNRLTEAQEMEEATRDAADDDGEDLSNEVDYFRDVEGLGGDGDDDDEASGSRPGMMDPSELRFADFFLPPSKAAQFRAKAERKKNRAETAKDGVKGKGKADEASEADELESEPEDEASDAESSEEPDRPRKIRFNDTVAIRRIKPRKKKRDSELTPEMLAELGFTEEDAARLTEEQDGSDQDEDEDADDDLDAEESGDEEGMDLDEEDEDEDEEENEDGASLPDEEAQAQTARRVAGDLFAESDDEDDAGAKASTHERRLAALQEEISRLEEENVGQKDWTLRGEASSKIRPQDSLLQEDLEFERTAKVTPQVTEEMTETIEDMIKRRILEHQFDDVVRRREMEALPFLPSRLLELSDAKSAKSLAELYEEEYQAARGAANGEAPRVAESDAKLQKEHEELTQIFDEVFDKLDALSNAHFTPKAPKATIQTLSNAPVVSIEEALPSTSSSATMLAPEEVYERQRHAVALEGDRSELTPEEKQRLHNQLRKEKRARNDKIQETRKALELAGLRRGGKSSKEEKEDAMRKLVGSRGVTVIGKDGSQKKGKEALGKKKAGSQAQRSNGAEATGSKFKL
ncbi:U3 snoRNP protein [Thecaphora frezii]